VWGCGGAKCRRASRAELHFPGIFPAGKRISFFLLEKKEAKKIPLAVI